MLNEHQKYRYSICSNGDLAELERIRSYIFERAQEFGFSSDIAQKISLAVDEACSNLIKHAFNKDNQKKICMEIVAEDKQFTINIMDDGAPFNPLEVAAPDMNEYFKQFKRGGLGIHIMRLIMDEISYRPQSDSNPKNCLCLKKYLNS